MSSSDKNKNMDEIEHSIERRLNYERASVKCMRTLLEPGSIDNILPRILNIVHRVVDNSRTYIFKNELDPDLGLCMSQIYEAVSYGIEPQIDNPELQYLSYNEATPTLLTVLESRQHFAHLVEELDDPERTILSEQGILSVLIIPIYAGKDFWGFIGFDDCVKAREWDENDIDLLRMIADGIGEFISHRKAENELRESEERYRALHNATFGGILIHDKGRILDCNQGLVDMTGYSKEELLANDSFTIVTKESKHIVMEKLASRSEEPYEITGRRKDGTEYPIRVQAKNIPYKGKQVRVTELRDITEEKESEKALKESEERFKALHQGSFGGIFIHINDIIIECNQGLSEITGYSQDELIGKKGITLAAERCRDKILDVIATDYEEPFEVIGLRKDRTEYPLKVQAKTIPYKGKNVRIVEFRDITERKESEKALRDSERKFMNYLENAPYGILILDEHGNYLEVNKTACKLTGYDENELTQMNISDIIAPESLITAGQSFDELKTRGYTSTELQVTHKDGSVSWIRRDGTKLSDNRFILFSSDITEMKKAEHSLIEAKMLAEHNNRIKSEFLANMSHELRTPLTAVIGFSDILQEGVAGELTEKQLGYVDHINKSGNHLLEIINDILDLSKIEAGKMELECEDFNVSELIDETLKSMYPMSGKKNIKLYLRNNINNGNVHADKIKIRQILYNLLSNAIKFTPDNGEVFISIEKTENGIQVSVTDTGIGIPSEMQDEIFSPFTQVDASSKRRYGGTGLGLALVKQFVEMHNGKVWLESEEGKGSTFTFTIKNQKKDD
ncbi:PAS domain S-box protein [Methanolobus vulcani]|uniref:histidine kinase n=1 Tax=Methanolobus vulcani TaxID=38026 RepID=A0A7Z8KMA6_9EURY|nr:PAS domain S-box protein [Methanolobus vulcani]TQD24363.1 PAS domain S-box protein [Methanolobus vulcani]